MNTAAELGLNVLLNAAWQLIAIAAVALAADRLLRHVARARHFLWVTALVMSVLLPLISARSAIWPTANAPAESAAAFEIPLLLPAPFAATVAPQSWTLSAIHVSQRVASIAVVLFLLAIAFRGFRILRAWLNTRHIRRTATPIHLHGHLQEVVERCEKAFATAKCRILSSTSLRTPATMGVFKPVLILPEHLIHEGDVSALTAAVGHELAHIRRRDYLLNLIYELIFLPLSVHPAAHFIKRRITHTRELRCDELVAQRLLQPDVYAKSLVRLAAWAVPPNQRAQSIMVGMADADILEVRVMSLLKKNRASILKTALFVIAAVALLAIPCVAAASWGLSFRVDAARPQEPSTGSQERRKLTDEQKAEIEKHEAAITDLKKKLAETTDGETRAKLEKELQEQAQKTLMLNNGGFLTLRVDPEGQRREQEMKQKHNAILASMAKISMDQAIQIATTKTPGKVLECSLVGERWSSPDELAKPSLVLYHVVILSGDDTAPVVNHVLVNAIDGSIFKSEPERRREALNESNQGWKTPSESENGPGRVEVRRP
jgi:beta-lactamase regulating signal transducer with metallopeptidase domain/uncharacterized membrane protein YkoI